MSTHCILQVEDSEEDVFFLQFAFKEAGVDALIQVARDGQEAIEYLSGNGPFADRTKFVLPSLVLLDLKLPRKSGWEVLEWMRRQPVLKKMPVIVLSGSAQPVDIDRAYLLGANSYLVKSSMDELTEMAKALKHYWLQHNHFPDGKLSQGQ
jgi:CheY-like chemotaxis protein